MSTVAEIEKAIGQLPQEQWTQIRRWMEAHAQPPAWPVPPPNVERAELERAELERAELERIEAEFPTLKG